MQFVLGLPSPSIYAQGSRCVHPTQEDMIACLLRFGESGPWGLLDVNWLTPEKRRELTVIGEGGMLSASYLTQDVWFTESSGAPTGWSELARIRGDAEGAAVRFALRRIEPLQAELEAFSRCVLDDTPEPVSAQEGCRALAAALAVRDSAAHSRPVRLLDARAPRAGARAGSPAAPSSRPSRRLSAAAPMIRFVIPAYNERENIPRLLADLGPVAHELGARVIFVDDGSSDGTAEEIAAHADGLHLAVVRHGVNRGLGTAINSGLRAALGESADGDAVVTLEADNTSDLSDLPRMLELFAPGPRRRARLGVCAGWRDPRRRAVARSPPRARSRAPFAIAGGLRDIHTLSSLYRVYRAGTLRRAAETYGYLLVREPGFAANVELLLKLYNAGASVAEVPTVNDWSRRMGTSKMNLRPTVLAYGRLMAAHLVGRIQPPPISPLGGEE